jgi:hypothetical protein
MLKSRKEKKLADTHLVQMATSDIIAGHVRDTVCRDTTTDVTENVIRVTLDGRRASSTSQEDKVFHLRTTRAFLAAGIPLNRLKILREALDDICSKSLGSTNNLAAEYIPLILQGEEEEQCSELSNKTVALIFDATPRMGDVFALLARFVEIKDGM